MDFFPNGVLIYAVGGGLLGLGVAVIYLGSGMIAGASTFLDSTLSYFSNLTPLKSYAGSRDWRLAFTLGIVVGAAVYALFFQTGPWVTQVQWWRLLGGGVLIGVGARLGKGCTSGHGICGVASLSKTSVLNVVTFMLFAIGTAQLVRALGVMP